MCEIMIFLSKNHNMEPHITSIIEQPFEKTPNQVLKLLLLRMISYTQELERDTKDVKYKLEQAVDYLSDQYCHPCSICET